MSDCLLWTKIALYQQGGIYHYFPIGARTIPISQLSRIIYYLKTIDDETCGVVYWPPERVRRLIGYGL